MIGKQVEHKAFGTGIIVSYGNGKIAVDFSGIVKLFQFPESFDRFLTTNDAVLQDKVNFAVKERSEIKIKKEEEQQNRKAEEETAATEERQDVSHLPFSPALNKNTPARRAHGTNESVAFKCNFCDGGSSDSHVGFRGVCSDRMIRYNIEKAKHIWCSTGSICKSYYDGKISRDALDVYRTPNESYAACYESSFFDTWMMGAGVYQVGEKAGKPMHLKRISRMSLAVMTTRAPIDQEKDRFIFAVFLINSAYSGDEEEEGNVLADPVWRIELAPTQARRMLFWKYYFNANKPDKIVFGSGLHRYLTSIEAAQILRDISSIMEDDFAKAFFKHFCEINDIDPNNLEAPSGALVRIGSGEND